MERQFTDQELEEMGRRTLDALDEAIQGGDKDRARYLAKRMYREFSAMHDLYVDWTAGLMERIYRSGGQDALYDAMKEVLAVSTQPEAAETRGFRDRVRDLAFVLRGHLVNLHMEEDADKVSITMRPCGSGQRLMEKGAYGPPMNLSMIDEPHPMTWNMKSFPIYCTHAPSWRFFPWRTGASPRWWFIRQARWPGSPVRTPFTRMLKIYPKRSTPGSAGASLGRKTAVVLQAAVQAEPFQLQCAQNHGRSSQVFLA